MTRTLSWCITGLAVFVVGLALTAVSMRGGLVPPAFTGVDTTLLRHIVRGVASRVPTLAVHVGAAMLVVTPFVRSSTSTGVRGDRVHVRGRRAPLVLVAIGVFAALVVIEAALARHVALVAEAAGEGGALQTDGALADGFADVIGVAVVPCTAVLLVMGLVGARGRASLALDVTAARAIGALGAVAACAALWLALWPALGSALGSALWGSVIADAAPPSVTHVVVVGDGTASVLVIEAQDWGSVAVLACVSIVASALGIMAANQCRGPGAAVRRTSFRWYSGGLAVMTGGLLWLPMLTKAAFSDWYVEQWVFGRFDSTAMQVYAVISSLLPVAAGCGTLLIVCGSALLLQFQPHERAGGRRGRRDSSPAPGGRVRELVVGGEA